ncbi:hypothetical protein PG999_005441 [Apiospora kogelbergensis]|uniref:Uncharacterized protein n=1 Tax=Apiospora kogelbergensis TaxID=1337665 RepID=A0AAW0R276_9PEZI
MIDPFTRGKGGSHYGWYDSKVDDSVSQQTAHVAPVYPTWQSGSRVVSIVGQDAEMDRRGGQDIEMPSVYGAGHPAKLQEGECSSARL